MRKIISVLLIASLLIVPASVCAETAQKNSEEQQKIYDYKQMEQIFLDNSNELKKIQVQHDINKESYEDATDQYENSTKQIDFLKSSKDSYEIQKGDALDEFVKHRVESMSRMKDRMQFEMYASMTDSFDTNYKNAVKGQLQSFEQMELLQLQLDHLNQTKVQNEMASLDQFKETAYNYSLVEEQKQLLEDEIKILENKIKAQKSKEEMGLSTQLEVKELENELLNKNKQVIELKNKVSESYETLKKLLNIDSKDNPVFNIDLPVPDVVEAIDKTAYINLVNKNTLQYLQMNKQKEIYDEQEGKIKIAYDENDEDEVNDYKLNMLDLEKKKINLGNNLINTSRLIENNYKNYELAVRSYKLQKDNMKLAEQEFNISENKHSMGLISDNDFDDAQYKYQTASYNFKQEILNYIHAQHKYVQEMNGIMSQYSK